MKYSNFYPTVTYPYIAIIDSMTGELMDTFTNESPKLFCQFLKDFIKSKGKLSNGNDGEVEHASPGPSRGEVVVVDSGDWLWWWLVVVIGCGDW